MQLINLANFDEFFLNILIVTVVCKAPSVNKGKKMSKLGFMCHFNETTGRTILKNEMIFFALPFFHSFVSAV